MRDILKLTALVVFAVPGVASAQQEGERRPLASLFACLYQSADVARLACLEGETRRLQVAERSRDVVVMDKQQAAELRRAAIAKDPGKAAKAERPVFAAFDDTLSAVSQSGTKWVLATKANGTWIQTDSSDLGRDPRTGDRLRVRRGAVGGFLANIGDSPAIRVRRLR